MAGDATMSGVPPATAGSAEAPEPASLTRSQAERRSRVIRAAMSLAAEGGYDAVQMRDVSGRADVALGTIYRYFSSKDHLLAASLLEWAVDLERQVSKRPPKGPTTADKLVDILERATGAMASEPRLTAAVMAALTSSDPEVARCQIEMNEVMTRIQTVAFPSDFDPVERAGVIRTLEHVWFSALLGWVNGWMTHETASEELSTSARLLLAGRA